MLDYEGPSVTLAYNKPRDSCLNKSNLYSMIWILVMKHNYNLVRPRKPKQIPIPQIPSSCRCTPNQKLQLQSAIIRDLKGRMKCHPRCGCPSSRSRSHLQILHMLGFDPNVLLLQVHLYFPHLSMFKFDSVSIEYLGYLFQREVLRFWVEEIYKDKVAEVQNLRNISKWSHSLSDTLRPATHGIHHCQCPCVPGRFKVIECNRIGVTVVFTRLVSVHVQENM